MASPDQNKANVKAFYDLAFNQRQPEEAVSGRRIANTTPWPVTAPSRIGSSCAVGTVKS